MGVELGRDRALYIHLTLVPFMAASSEIKTKPTQHSVKELRSRVRPGRPRRSGPERTDRQRRKRRRGRGRGSVEGFG
jgi:hypothetical protein